MATIFKDSSYSKKGAFPEFLTQTDEKQVTFNYIVAELKEKYNFKNYNNNKFTFTDIGAGEGTLTLPILQYLKKSVNDLEVYLIEPSSLIDILKKKCGLTVHYIQKGMEDISLPRSDFILMAHSIQYLKNRKAFSKNLKNALNPGGKILFVGTHPESDDLKLKKELFPKVLKKSNKITENLFEYLEKEGFTITREYLKSNIDISNTEKVVSFFYHKPLSDISKEETLAFYKSAKKFAPNNKLTKLLQFIWVE